MQKNRNSSVNLDERRKLGRAEEKKQISKKK